QDTFSSCRLEMDFATGRTIWQISLDHSTPIGNHIAGSRRILIMDLKTLSSTGILLGGLGVFAIAQNQPTISPPSIISQGVTTQSLLTSAMIGQTPAAKPNAPTVGTLFTRFGNSEQNLGAITHLTTGVFLP